MLLRVLRESCPALEAQWPDSQAPEAWKGVGMEDDRVVRLNFSPYPTRWTRPLLAVPAVIGQLTSLEQLNLRGNKLTSLPAEIGQLTSLEQLNLGGNKLTSLPVEVGQLTSLKELSLGGNRLTSLPVEVGQLPPLQTLDLCGNRLIRVPAAIRELRAAGCSMHLDDGVTVDE